MLNAYVIEILVVQVLYMIRKLTEARVYFITLILFLVYLRDTYYMNEYEWQLYMDITCSIIISA